MGLSIYTGPYYGYYSPGYSAGYAPGIAPTESQPIIEEQPTTPASPAKEDRDYGREAEEAFRAGEFEEAARLASHALVDRPEDGRLHLFTAQALFAVGDYEGAAAGIHQAAALLPESDWGSVVENFRQYYRGRTYVEQMNKLNEFIQENPEAPFAHFVRGYQNGFLGHTQAAIRDLKKANELEPRDELAMDLIGRFEGSSEDSIPSRPGGTNAEPLREPARLNSEPKPPEPPR